MKVTVEEIKSKPTHALLRALLRKTWAPPTISSCAQTYFKNDSNAGVEGVRVLLKGVSTDQKWVVKWLREGRIPLQTLRADVDLRARPRRFHTDIGIKVWIYRGEIFAKEQAEHVVAANNTEICYFKKVKHRKWQKEDLGSVLLKRGA